MRKRELNAWDTAVLEAGLDHAAKESAGNGAFDPTPLMLINEIYRLCRVSMHNELAEFGSMRMSRRVILRHLARANGATQQALAEATHLSAPTVSVEIAEMEKAGLVRRERSESDGRAFEVKLTERGVEAKKRLDARMKEDERVMQAGLSAEEIAELKRCLKVMRDNIVHDLSDGEVRK